MNAARIYMRYAGISIRSQMQYRASFVMLAIGHFLGTGVEMLGIWALFARFRMLGTWRLAEVALFYGLVNVAFALAESVGRGFDLFPGMVKGGQFDRLLLRPRSTALQVAACELQLMRVGRFAQGLIVLLWAAWALQVDWTVGRIALAAFAVFGGMCLFMGLFVLQATLAFWTTETLELMNTVTYGGTETGKFPLTIYRRWFRAFFTFVVPLASVTYFPALAILDRPDPLGSPLWFRCAAPLIGVLFLVAALYVWRFGVRRYRSTGS
ncbi:MAG TPA: ABC-2 family transporter protein [Phycisphaerae bacterium]|nr:ABC-2 family transporter protein [Phycisphaerae bacterium]